MSATDQNAHTRPYLGDSSSVMSVDPNANLTAIHEEASTRLHAILNLCRGIDPCAESVRASDVMPLMELATREALDLIHALHEASQRKGGAS